MTSNDTDVMDRAVRDALFDRMPEARELSFDRIDTRATRRRHRTIASQIAVLTVVLACAGAAIALNHAGSTPRSLQVTNPNGTVTPLTHEPSRHHTTATSAPTGLANPGTIAPPHNVRTPSSSPENVVVPPATNAPSNHTTTPQHTPATSPPPHVATTPTTVYLPTIPSNLPPTSNPITASRVIVILTDSGYWIDDSTGLHEGTTAHIVNHGLFDVVFLDERTASPNTAWLFLVFDHPGGSSASGSVHAWDGAPNGLLKPEVISFGFDVVSGSILARTSSSAVDDSNAIPGTAATLTLVKD
jgi:hypothetical protein